MKKVIKLSESDLVRLVKKVVNEQIEEKRIANKVETLVDIPEFEKRLTSLLDTMSLRDQEKLWMKLQKLGIDENSSAEEVHAVLDSYTQNTEDLEQEMTEGDENDKKSKMKEKTAEILHNIGAGNIAAWGGVPAAILIGSMTGMPIGFAASWGATALLMGLAKVLGKKH